MKSVFVCGSCGSRTPRWQGQCPACRDWNTLTEEVVRESPRAAGRGGHGAVPPPLAASLAELPGEALRATSTGMPELDRFLGRGLVPGSAILLGGEPGVGKSTLLLQLAGAVAAQGRTAVYVTGEESLAQLKDRALRLGVLHENLRALASGSADEAAALCASANPDLMIVDSVQTLASSLADGLPGSVSQVRAVGAQLIEAAKKSDCALFLVGHVTKDGQIAGPKLLEHMVDAVLYLEGDRRHLSRILRVLKNRFGPSDELIVFAMREAGMTPVPDASTFFLEEREPGLPGTALVMAVDGHKPFAVEVQALVSKSYLSIPRRTGLGFDVNRLHLLLAVLEKQLRLNLGQSDIYAKLGGGLKLVDPGLDLGLVAAVLSSFYDRPLPDGACFFGEVDLNGRIRQVTAYETRRKQAERLGYGPIFCPDGARGVRRLSDFAAALFGAGSHQ